MTGVVTCVRGRRGGGRDDGCRRVCCSAEGLVSVCGWEGPGAGDLGLSGGGSACGALTDRVGAAASGACMLTGALGEVTSAPVEVAADLGGCAGPGWEPRASRGCPNLLGWPCPIKMRAVSC